MPKTSKNIYHWSYHNYVEFPKGLLLKKFRTLGTFSVSRTLRRGGKSASLTLGLGERMNPARVAKEVVRVNAKGLSTTSAVMR